VAARSRPESALVVVDAANPLCRSYLSMAFGAVYWRGYLGLASHSGFIIGLSRTALIPLQKMVRKKVSVAL